MNFYLKSNAKESTLVVEINTIFLFWQKYQHMMTNHQQYKDSFNQSQIEEDVMVGMRENDETTGQSNGNYFTTRGMNMSLAGTNNRISHINIPVMPPLQGQNAPVAEIQNNNVNVVTNEEEIVLGTSQNSSMQLFDTNARSPKLARKMNIIQVYAKGDALVKDSELEADMKKNFRSVLLPTIKFIQTGKNFGSFEQQDLTDPSCIASRLFSAFPAIANESDATKARYWITYRAKLKEVVSMHKAKATLIMKRKIMNGKLS